MGAITSIAWTERTFNGWWGCTKISPGCDNCYAAAFDHRLGGDHWGAGVGRRYFDDRHWNQPLKWNRIAEKAGKRCLVFCASMSDVFDNEVPDEQRTRLFRLMRATPWLEWQVVTKRIGNAPKMLPADWGNGYDNVWLLSTVVTQEEVYRDIPKLLEIPAVVHGLSVEPQIQRVTLGRFLESPVGVDWVISGGESGAKARPFDVEWARSLRNECAKEGAAFFFKQTGDKPIGLKVTGKGDDPDEWPADIRVREFPEWLYRPTLKATLQPPQMLL